MICAKIDLLLLAIRSLALMTKSVQSYTIAKTINQHVESHALPLQCQTLRPNLFHLLFFLNRYSKAMSIRRSYVISTTPVSITNCTLRTILFWNSCLFFFLTPSPPPLFLSLSLYFNILCAYTQNLNQLPFCVYVIKSMISPVWQKNHAKKTPSTWNDYYAMKKN